MCRIAGVVSSEHPLELLEAQVRTLCESQQHGGPDDEGFYTDPEAGVVLGHRRLALIDLSPGGHQPMRWADDDLVISFNGEIYNYLSLKNDLQQMGFRFQTASDTEVILAAFTAWGTDAFKRFAGMFAFALYDRREQKVYLVRDPSGIKPLYYSCKNGAVYFASEVRALGNLPELQTQNQHWPIYFLAYGHLPEPVTTLSDVKPLPKGCFLQFELRSQRSSVQSYCRFSYLEKFDQKETILREIRDCLHMAVERHLLSDAPIGAFLSGGIDSSLMALLAGTAVGEKLTTLSIYFAEKDYSEKKFQDLISAKLKGSHRAYCLDKNEFDNSFAQILAAMDLPSNDGINTWFISKYAREAGLKAVLSGLGGDELFGGYPSFQRMKTAAYLQRLPSATLKAGAISGFPKMKRLAYLRLPGIKGRYLFLRGQYVPSEIARQLDVSEEQVWRLLEEQPNLPVIDHMTPKNQASWMEMNLYMQNQLLRDSDVMSMAHGVEIRVPFLDPDFIKLVLQIQSSLKYEGTGKQLLTEAFTSILPAEIYNRPKMGFSFPFKEWLAQNAEMREQLYDAGTAARQVYGDFLKGQRHWSQVLSLLLIHRPYAAKKASFSYA